jgi:hypothetical protein
MKFKEDTSFFFKWMYHFKLISSPIEDKDAINYMVTTMLSVALLLVTVINLHSAGRRNEFDIFTDSVFKHYVNLYYISKWLTYDSNLMPYISNESFLQ